MNEEQISELDKVYDEERKRQRAEAVARHFSPEIRATPLAQAIAAGAAGCDGWQALLQGWVEEQWVLHRAAKDELVDASTIAELQAWAPEPQPLAEEVSSSTSTGNYVFVRFTKLS